MPIYDYHCADCDTGFSVFVSMNDEIEECEKCHSANVSRVVSGLVSPVKDADYCKKVGDVVKEHIEEAKQELKKEKVSLRREMK